MKEILKQKKWPHFRHYEIVPEGLNFEVKNDDGYSSLLIKFEELGFDIQVHDKKPSAVKTGLFVSITFNFILLLLLLLIGDRFID